MISKKEALIIAKGRFIPEDSAFTIYEEFPESLNFYMALNEPAWYILCPTNPTFDDEMFLRSSRLIVVSKISGKVLYDGTAGNEG